MKKIILIALLIGAALAGFSQGAAKVTLKASINNIVKPNGTKSINASQLNTLLNAINDLNRDSTQVAAMISSLASGSLLPSQVGQGGKLFRTNGTSGLWGTIDTSDITNFYLKVRNAYSAGANITITNGVISSSGSGGGGTWGSITGTLSGQTDLNSALGLKAPLASPGLTGVPTAPTAAAATNTTQVATTAHVFAERSNTATLTNKTIGADQLTDGTTNKAFLATERTKLAGIATGATANSADATLLARGNHTGTQAESTVTNLVSDLAGKMTAAAFTDSINAANNSFTLRNSKSSGDSLFLATGTNGYILKRLAAGTGMTITKTSDSLLTLSSSGGGSGNDTALVKVEVSSDSSLLIFTHSNRAIKKDSLRILTLYEPPKMPLYLGINAQTGTTYTFALADTSGRLITASNASAQTYTIPTSASVALPIGTQITVEQEGAGQVTFAAAGGVTIHSAGGALKLRLQYSSATIIKKATNTWLLIGDITN